MENGLVRACFISLQTWHSFVVTLLFNVYFYLASVTIPGFRARLSNLLAQYSHGKSCAGEPYLENQFATQPRSQGSLLHTRETLENAGHVSPRFWEITKDNMEGGAVKSEVCQYLAYPGTKTTCFNRKKHIWFVRSPRRDTQTKKFRMARLHKQ